MRAITLLTLLAFFAAVPSLAAEAAEAAQLPTNIPAQELASALRTLAKERNFQIVYASQDVAGRKTRGAVGTFTEHEALQKLLEGTGMTYQPLDERTVTVTLAAAKAPEPAQNSPARDRVAAPALPEVEVSAERDDPAAVRAKMVKLEDEFFAQYNRLNTDDQFDISCHEEVPTGLRVEGRVCRPAFVDKLQLPGASGVSSCSGDSCQANLFVPPLAAVLAKSEAYEKNVLGLINRYPQLSKVVREREALEARYEALRAHDSRRSSERQSKRGDTLCTNEPGGTFMRMTFAMTGYALCTGLFIAADADAAGSTGELVLEVEINARRESLRHLRSEIVRLEQDFYAKYNELNTDDQYDIQCERAVPTGSTLRRRECHPVFVNRATAAEAYSFLGAYAVVPASSVIVRKWPDFEKTLLKAIETQPELQKLAATHVAMQKRYEVVRKLKFKGKIIVVD